MGCGWVALAAADDPSYKDWYKIKWAIESERKLPGYAMQPESEKISGEKQKCGYYDLSIKQEARGKNKWGDLELETDIYKNAGTSRTVSGQKVGFIELEDCKFPKAKPGK